MSVEYRIDTSGVNWAELIEHLELDNFNNGRTPEELARSFDNSWAVAFAWLSGSVVGTARALSDGVCNAYIVDVWTLSPLRHQGIARTLMSKLEEQLDGQHVYLFTDDADEFYEKTGYVRRGAGFEKVVGSWLRRR